MAQNRELGARIVALLNEAFAADPAAVSQLADNRVPCNDKLADHPSIQLGGVSGKNTIGMVGLFNGLAGVNENGWGCVSASYDSKTGRLLGFLLLDEDVGAA